MHTAFGLLTDSVKSHQNAAHLDKIVSGLVQGAASDPGECVGESRSCAISPPQADSSRRLLLCIPYGDCAAQARDALAAGLLRLPA